MAILKQQSRVCGVPLGGCMLRWPNVRDKLLRRDLSVFNQSVSNPDCLSPLVMEPTGAVKPETWNTSRDKSFPVNLRQATYDNHEVHESLDIIHNKSY